MRMIQPAPGQVWRLKDPSKYYNVGDKNDIFIITHKDIDSWGIATFWWSGDDKLGDDKSWGGARPHVLSAEEINEIGEYVSTLQELLDGSKKRLECPDCIEAQKEGYTMCGECSVPWCSWCGAMRKAQCDCGPIADND
jgi:hypothetical protein